MAHLGSSLVHPRPYPLAPPLASPPGHSFHSSPHGRRQRPRCPVASERDEMHVVAGDQRAHGGSRRAGPAGTLPQRWRARTHQPPTEPNPVKREPMVAAIRCGDAVTGDHGSGGCCDRPAAVALCIGWHRIRRGLGPVVAEAASCGHSHGVCKMRWGRGCKRRCGC